MWPSTVAHMGPVRDVLVCPGTLGWEGHGIVDLHCGTHGTCPGCPSVSRDSGTSRTVGLWPSTVGHTGPVRDVLVCPGTLGWEGQWDCGPPLWDTWDLSRMSQGSRDSGMGRTVGLWPSTVGHTGPVRDVLVCPGTLGWEGQWDCGPPLWDTWDPSGMSQGSRDSGMGRTVGFWTSTVGHMGPVRDVPGVPGLWDGKDSGIVALHCGTHGTCPGCLRGPGTLGWEGQWDCGPPLWDTWDWKDSQIAV